MISSYSINKTWCVCLRKAFQAFCALLGLLLLCPPAYSQGSFGRILGTVTDQSGGVVAGATVTVLDKDRGVSRTLTADDAGAYNAPNLTPGNYTVRVESKGFKVHERTGIVLDVGKEIRIDAALQPGEQNQTITITESVPLVETTNATMGGTLENADIVDLPLNGRDYQNLLSLRPGVQLYPGGGPWTQSANGTRPDESVWMVDGVLNISTFDARPIEGFPGPFQDSATVLPIDAIQEFNVMENPKAEYGWKSGAVVNVGIKSGTNSLHGSAYAFGRTTGWDARNYFNVAPVNGTCITNPAIPSACDQVPVSVKQFGGVVGGPIKKDKLFFFGGYEGYRDFIGSDYSLTVPATASIGDPSHSMVDAITALQSAHIPVSAVSLATTGCTLGPPVTCTGGLYPNTGTSNSFLSTFPIQSHSDNGIGKLDWHANDKNTISGSLFTSRYNALGEDHGFVNQAFNDNTPITAWSTVASWVYTPNSNVVNELRFGYNRVSFDFVNVDIGNFANGTGVYNFINTGAPTGGFPNVNISGLAPLGTNSNRPQFNDGNPYYDIQDSISILRGKHTIKFGGEFSHSEADAAILVGGRGIFNFPGGGAFGGSSPSSPLEDFFAGTPTSATLLTGNAFVRTTWKTGSGFLQDDWRVTPKLIINLGLRYAYTTPMKAANNAFGSFNPAIGLTQQGLTQQGSSGVGTGGVWNGYFRSFDPRFGLAYDISGKGTTVIRGGVSVVHTLIWPLLTWDGQFGLQNDGSTSLAAVPTGAVIQCVPPNVCPSSGGGNITLGAATFGPSQLCWDPTNPNSTACNNGQKTIFPVAKTPQCGDGLPLQVPNPAIPSGSDASPCDIMGVNPNLVNPYVLNYNLSITHQIGSNLSIEIAYVGNHGYNLLNFSDANQAPLGAGWCLNTLTAAQIAGACASVAATGLPLASYNPLATQQARPFYSRFPYLGFINFANNGAHSNYNSFQTTITKRMSHGLSFVAGYTYGHGLDNGSINRFGPLPQDSTNIEGEYGNSDFDIRHRLTVTATYNIPGKKGFGQLLEGWQINGIYSYSTPQPWSVWDSGDNISGTGENADRWDIFGNPLDFPAGKNSIPFCSGFGSTAGPSCGFTNPYVGGNGTPFTGSGAAVGIANCLTHAQGSATAGTATLGSFGCFISTNGNSVLVPPALGSFGNMGRNIFRDSGFNNLDLSIFKNFTIKERYGFQFRWEVFNVLNHPIAANPYGSSSFVNGGNQFQGGGPLGYAGVTNDFAAGNPLIGSGSQRVMQVGLKITF